MLCSLWYLWGGGGGGQDDAGIKRTYCNSIVLIAFTKESTTKEEWFVKCLFSRERPESL